MGEAAKDVTESSLEEIPRHECLELLASQPIGRVAVASPGSAPLVVPVNYLLDGEVVVFRSDIGAKLHALRHPVSFQVDCVDAIHRTGWSVLIRGTAYEATHWEVDHLHLESWAGDDKQHWVRVVPDVITGRRIRRPEQLAFDSRGYL